MPLAGTEQSDMKLYHGKAPMVDSNGILADLIFYPKVTAKTTAYTCKAYETGTVFTTTGATAAVTFTLPAATSKWSFIFVNAVDLDMTVAAATADTLVTFNDAEADSVSFSTTSEKIGGAVWCFSDGTKPHAIQLGVGGHRQTMTITTA